MKGLLQLKGAIGCLALVCLLSACSANADRIQSRASGDAAVSAADPSDVHRLDQLWEQRTRDAFAAKFSIGPGDVFEVSVADVPELQKREVLVSPDDTITLPLVGTVRVAGMNQEGLRRALRQRLARYIKDPELDLFVKKNKSSQVAVVGMVEKPGLYAQTSRADTIQEMISRAGGMTAKAGMRVIFIPASGASGSGILPVSLLRADTHDDGTSDNPHPGLAHAARKTQVETAERVAPRHESPAQFVRHTLFTPALSDANPIVISLAGSQGERFLNFPTRPGDVIIVPPAGEVMVQGWVQNPGAFRITPRMTALGAITAAGGQLFSSSAEVLRTGKNGQKLKLPIDLAKVKRGEEPDVPVESGDVIIVNRSATGAVPYLFYTLFNRFGTGIYAPVP